MLAVLIFAEATLNLDAASSSILFDNSARLTATCQNPAPPPPLSPGIARMIPTEFHGLPASGDMVRLRLKDVPLSCAGTDSNKPCALPFDEFDVPNFFCTWNNSHASAVTGPVPGSATFHQSVNASEQAKMAVAVHSAHTSACATHCSRSPPLMFPTLWCPLPGMDASWLGGAATGSVFLYVSYFAPASSPKAVQVRRARARNLSGGACVPAGCCASRRVMRTAVWGWRVALCASCPSPAARMRSRSPCHRPRHPPTLRRRLRPPRRRPSPTYFHGTGGRMPE